MGLTVPAGSRIAVVGGGPAGLMAAETLVGHGAQVDLYDAMPSVGRKFLLAGKGGLNLTHSEPSELFHGRFGARRPEIAPMLEQFGADDLRAWAEELGIATFIGSSGRVFPTDMKAAPLLRAWLQRLRRSGVNFHMRHRWCGWSSDGALRFSTPDGDSFVQADAAVLALGGGSWARLGSDAAWVPLLAEKGVPIEALRPSNCGFDVNWSEHFKNRFAGQPVKPVALSVVDHRGVAHRRQGEFMVTESGVEGSLIYAMSSSLRDTIASAGKVRIHLDLAPSWTLERVNAEVARPRGSRSWASHLQSRVNITGVKAGLLREILQAQDFAEPGRVAATIKNLPLDLVAVRPLDEAISSAGGVAFEGLDEGLMIRAAPGNFCAGEMLEWEAPTGGYMLTACFASGRAAGIGALSWLAAKRGADNVS